MGRVVWVIMLVRYYWTALCKAPGRKQWPGCSSAIHRARKNMTSLLQCECYWKMYRYSLEK